MYSDPCGLLCLLYLFFPLPDLFHEGHRPPFSSPLLFLGTLTKERLHEGRSGSTGTRTIRSLESDYTFLFLATRRAE